MNKIHSLSLNEARQILDLVKEQQELLKLLLDCYPAETETAKREMIASIERIAEKTDRAIRVFLTHYENAKDYDNFMRNLNQRRIRTVDPAGEIVVAWTEVEAVCMEERPEPTHTAYTAGVLERMREDAPR